MAASDQNVCRILDIRLRDSPTGRFATVTVAEGFKAEDIRRTLLAAIFCKRRVVPHPSSGATHDNASIPRPLSHETMDLTLDNTQETNKYRTPRISTSGSPHEDVITAHRTGNAIVVDREAAQEVSAVPEEYGPTEEPMSISSDSDPAEVQIPDDPLSPALSYLTLDDPRVDELAASPGGESRAQSSQHPSDEDVQHEVHPRAARCAVYGGNSELAESDSDSDNDNSSEAGVHPFQSARAVSVAGAESLATRVLHGTVAIEDAIAAASEDQRSHLQRAFAQAISSHVEDDEEEESRADNSSDDDDSEDSAPLGPDKTLSLRGKGMGLNTGVDDNRSTQAFQDDGYRVKLPKAREAKGRRLLIPPDETLPIVAVYMRGDVQFIDQRDR